MFSFNESEKKILKGTMVLLAMAALIGALTGCGKSEKANGEIADDVINKVTTEACLGDENTICEFVFDIGSNPHYVWKTPITDGIPDYTIESCSVAGGLNCIQVFAVSCFAITGSCTVDQLLYGNIYTANVSDDSANNRRVISFQGDETVSESEYTGPAAKFFRIRAGSGAYTNGVSSSN